MKRYSTITLVLAAMLSLGIGTLRGQVAVESSSNSQGATALCFAGTRQLRTAEIMARPIQPGTYPVLDANCIARFTSRERNKRAEQWVSPVDWQAVQGVLLLCKEDHVVRIVPATHNQKPALCVTECIIGRPVPFCVSE